MKIGPFITFPIIQILLAAGCLSMAGCAPAPAPAPAPVLVSVYQACEIDPEVWKQTPIPPEREALLDLKNDQAKVPTRKYFVISGNETESWFENSNHDLAACRYGQLQICGGGVFSTVIFRRNGASWNAEPTLSRICTD